VHLLGLGERLAVRAIADDVVGGEALGFVLFGRLQHPQADVDDHVRRAFDGAGYQAKPILGGDGWRWRVGGAHALGAVVADQECGDSQSTGFNLW